MDTGSSNICLNCEAKNEVAFKYCSTCGQKNTDGKITFSQLWSEFQDSMLNIDSRTWRTLKDLFVPGRLTLEYFSGKHGRYVHPLRLLLATSLLFILAMSFQGFRSATNHGYDYNERILKNYERQRLYGILDKITDNTNTLFPDQLTEAITDTIMTSFYDSLMVLLDDSENMYASIHGDRYGSNIDLNRYASLGSEKAEVVSKYDFLNKSEDELVEIYKKDAGRIEQLIFKQKVKHVKDESQIMGALISHTTWAALLLMPCLALVLFFLNFRHQYYYIEHLIFTFHLHACIFLVSAVLVAGLNVFPVWMFPLFMSMVGIYVFISMLKVYKQHFVKTLIKFLILSISYGGLLIFFLFGTVVFTFLLL